jgi:hypothetical protein
VAGWVGKHLNVGSKRGHTSGSDWCPSPAPPHAQPIQHNTRDNTRGKHRHTTENANHLTTHATLQGAKSRTRHSRNTHATHTRHTRDTPYTQDTHTTLRAQSAQQGSVSDSPRGALQTIQHGVQAPTSQGRVVRQVIEAPPGLGGAHHSPRRRVPQGDVVGQAAPVAATMG